MEAKKPKEIGKELIERLRFEKLRWQVSEADTHKIAKMLGTWWEMLANKLGFDEMEVDNIKTQYKDNLEMQKYKLLLKWNYRNGSKATYMVILNRLCSLEQIDCLDEVCKLLLAQSKPGPPPPSVLAMYSGHLKQKYANHKFQTVVDWPPPLYGNFMRLAMISEQGVRRGEMDPQFIGQITHGNVESILKKKIEIQPHEIFNKLDGKVVLIEGAPGSGKTTLCWYICQEWGKGKLFQQFSHILMVELRDEDTQSAKCFADMLPYCEGEEVDRIADELKEKKGENVLLILEGWDELHEEKRKKSIFKHLIGKGTRCLLHEAVILISSRSSVSAAIHPLAQMRIEILGFTPDQMTKYVQVSFGDEIQKAAGLLNKIRQNPKLQGACYFPLNLMLIVHLYIINQQLPESFCSIIIQLVLTCLYRYRRNKFELEDDFESFNELPDDVRPQFFELCKLAYEATIEERHSFSKLRIEHLGLMQSVQSIAARGNKTTQYFLHSSLQELCAAIHISTQTIPEQKRMLEMVFAASKDYVLRFYSALTHWEDPSLYKVLFEHSEAIIKTPTRSLPNFFPLLIHITNFVGKCQGTTESNKEMTEQKVMDAIDLAFPTQGRDETNMKIFMKAMFEECIKQNKSFQKVAEQIFEEADQLFNAMAQANDIPNEDFFCAQVIQQIIKRCRHEIDENSQNLQVGIPVSSHEQLVRNSRLLYLDIFKKYFDTMTMIMSIRQEAKTHQDFLKLAYKNLLITTTSQQQVIASLADVMRTHNMLTLIHCIYEAGNPALAEILGSRLVLAGELNASDMIALQSILEDSGGSTCNVETLYMFIAIPLSEVGRVTKVIEKCSAIKDLALDIGCYDETLARTVLSKPTIRRLRYKWAMQNEEYSKQSCVSFFSCLRGNQNLLILDLSSFYIHNCGAKELARVINTTRLVAINLTSCVIEEEGIRALASALETNNYLQILHLNKVIISPAALKHLSQSLTHNNTLKVLGIVESRFATYLTEENLKEFIMQFGFNSSVTRILLNGSRIHEPSLQQAIAFVNRKRRAKHQPQLSINRLPSQNYNPEMYNDRGIDYVIIQALMRSINIVNDGGFPKKELSVQECYQILIQNMSTSQVPQPSSQTVDINTCVQKRPCMCSSQLLQLNCQMISIEKHKARQHVIINIYGEALHNIYGLIVKKRLQPECVYPSQSLGLLLALIRGNIPDIDQVTHECIHPLTQALQQYIEVTIPPLPNMVAGSIISHFVPHNQSKIFRILLDNLLYCISLMIT